jgi:peptidoglycan hydrolase-like protein with peptidoglycan-binding domain
MKKINEYELLDRVNGLREKIVESEQQAQEDVMGTLAKYAAPVGNAIKGAAGKAWNGVKAAGSALANNPVKTALGVAGATGLAANALGGPGASAAAPKGTTAPKGGGKSDPAVLKQQQDLIAKGAKIKADGIMGPATQAAIAQFGGAAAAPAATTAPAAPPAGAPGAQDDATGVDAAVAAQQAAGAPQASMDDSDDVNAREFVPPTAAAPAAAPVATNAASLKAAQDAAAGNAPAAAAPAQKQYGGYGQAPAAAPAAAAPTAAQALVAKAGLPQPGASADDMLANMQKAMPDPAKMMADQQARMAAMKAKQPAQSSPGTWTQQGVPAANESVGFQNEELSRIISLVHHR